MTKKESKSGTGEAAKSVEENHAPVDKKQDHREGIQTEKIEAIIEVKDHQVNITELLSDDEREIRHETTPGEDADTEHTRLEGEGNDRVATDNGRLKEKSVAVKKDVTHEGTNNDEKKNPSSKPVYMCMQYRYNNCSMSGKECKYLHIDDEIQKICRNYRAGLDCTYGSECKYRHAVLSRREEQCKYQQTRQGCNKAECPYYHLTEEEVNQKKRIQRVNHKKDDDQVIEEGASKNEENQETKNLMGLGMGLEQLIQTQLVQLLVERGILKGQTNQEELIRNVQILRDRQTQM